MRAVGLPPVIRLPVSEIEDISVWTILAIGFVLACWLGCWASAADSYACQS